MNTHEISCVHCGVRAEVSSALAVGAAMKESGFEPLLLDDTNILWICRRCTAGLVAHVRAVEEILGECSGRVYWNCLKSISRRWRGEAEDERVG